MRHEVDSLFAYCVTLTAGLFFLCESILVNAFGTLSLDMMSDFHVDAYAFGKLSASYLLANILLLFPAGILLDRLSVKKVLLFSITTCALGAMIFSQTAHFYTAVGCIFISGAGGTFCFLGTMKLASRWFSPQKLAWVTGLIVTLAMLGGLIAQTPVAILANHFGWRSLFQVLAFVEAFFCLLTFLILKDSPEKDDFTDLPLSLASVFKSIQIAIRTPLNWVCGIFTSTMNLPVTLIGAVWGVPFLIQAHHFSRTESASINAFIFIGMMIGPAISGKLSDYLRSRTLIMAGGTLVSLAVILAIMLFTSDTAWTYRFLFFSLGFFSSVQILGYTVLVENTPPAMTGASLSVSCVLVMSGGTFLQPLFGKIMQLYWTGEMANHTPVYSTQAYHTAMMMLPVAFCIALAMIVILYRKSLKKAPLAVSQPLLSV
jgi:MFS family permease